MHLSPEICRQIVEQIGGRADICSLCRVSRTFQRIAERALYNTLYMRKPSTTIKLCDSLYRLPRLSALVEAITVCPYDIQIYDEDDDEVDGESEISESPLPESYWPSLSSALRSTGRLLYLSIHINSSDNLSAAWILTGCAFQLRTFHCDLKWDPDLISFLNDQLRLTDLNVVDYSDLTTELSTEGPPTTSHRLSQSSLPELSILECTFTEAAGALIPGRPITRLKTCFSASGISGKLAELSNLVSKISRSTRSLRTLDIADSSYTEDFSMEMLQAIALKLPDVGELRYLGTLVLPIAGRQRLQFYGLLRRISGLECLEVDVSEWVPSPTSVPVALRSLASELRLYCPSVTRVIFVYEYQRFVVMAVDGICRFEDGINTETLWKDI